MKTLEFGFFSPKKEPCVNEQKQKNIGYENRWPGPRYSADVIIGNRPKKWCRKKCFGMSKYIQNNMNAPGQKGPDRLFEDSP